MTKYHVINETAGINLGALDAHGNSQPYDATESQISAVAESSHDSHPAALAACADAGADRWIVDAETGDTEYISVR